MPTSRIFLSTFYTFCPDGVQDAQKVDHFAHFQVQARKRGVLGGVGGVLCMYISRNECVTGPDGWERDRGWVWYSWQNETPSGQNETHLGNLYVGRSALERIGKKH